MGTRNFLLLGLAFAAPLSGTAATSPPAIVSGSHLSACEPMLLHRRRTFTRLRFEFKGRKYSSSETLYSDPKCEISVLETTSQGSWRIERGNVLSLRLSRLQMKPLDPRMADRLLASRTCGKSWENGVANEILGTSCSHSRRAEYFVGSSPSAKNLELFECEGRRRIGPGCTRYEMAKARN